MPDARLAATRSAPSSSRLALAAGLAVVSVWGANFTVQKALCEVLPPAAFLCVR